MVKTLDGKTKLRTDFHSLKPHFLSLLTSLIFSSSLIIFSVKMALADFISNYASLDFHPLQFIERPGVFFSHKLTLFCFILVLLGLLLCLLVDIFNTAINSCIWPVFSQPLVAVLHVQSMWVLGDLLSVMWSHVCTQRVSPLVEEVIQTLK